MPTEAGHKWSAQPREEERRVRVHGGASWPSGVRLPAKALSEEERAEIEGHFKFAGVSSEHVMRCVLLAQQTQEFAQEFPELQHTCRMHARSALVRSLCVRVSKALSDGTFLAEHKAVVADHSAELAELHAELGGAGPVVPWSSSRLTELTTTAEELVEYRKAGRERLKYTICLKRISLHRARTS